jgi:ribosomal protein S27E
MRIIRGTKDAKGNVISRTPEGGVGRIRCMRCQNLCTSAMMPDGTSVMRCAACGANFTMTGMSPAAVDPPHRVGVPRPKRIPT